MDRTFAWWIAYGDSKAACIVEAPASGGILSALRVAWEYRCDGKGTVEATYLTPREMEATVPRDRWYALLPIDDWRARGVTFTGGALPPGLQR